MKQKQNQDVQNSDELNQDVQNQDELNQDVQNQVNINKMNVEFQKYWKQNKQRLIQDFITLLKYKSISTNPNYRQDLFKCFVFLKNYIQNMGFTTIYAIGKNVQQQINEQTDKQLMQFLHENFVNELENPVLVGIYEVNKDAPWVVVYGHYDVQPVDPEKWKSDPFVPDIRHNKIYARGASDDKGRFFANLIGLQYLITTNQLHVNVALVIEGEEEIAGNTVQHAFEFIKQKFAEPVVSYINDTTWFTDNIPSIMYSLRGVVDFELILQTGKIDVHSGLYGNIALNAANLAGYVIYKLKDVIRNRLRIDRLNRLVRTPSNQEIKFLQDISPSWEQAKQSANTYFITRYKRKSHEFLPLHMIGLRPSLDVHGIISGYTKPGIKMIIPHQAVIKFSIRTVPYMTSDKTIDLVQKYIDKILKRFKGIKYELKVFSSAPYVWQDYNNKYMQVTQQIMSQIFGTQAYFVPHGASNLAAGIVKDIFTNTVLLMPAIGKPSHNIHAENENIEINMLEKGALLLAGVLQYI